MLPRVVLLHDAVAAAGRADANDVLHEARHIAHGLEALGYQAVIVPVGLDLEDLAASLADLTPVVVFNLMESIAGHGRLIHVVPALLEALRVPYTGCSAFAQWMTSNKVVAKRRLEQAGTATPELLVAGRIRSRESAVSGPWIVKSVWEHASLGLDDDSLVGGCSEAEASIAEREQRFGGEWFAERYIAGRELNVAIIASDRGPRVLPIAEIRFLDFPPGKPQIVGYAAKWQPDSFEYTSTVRTFDVEPELGAEAARVAMRCWELFELGGYARVDFRIDGHGRLWVLEVNANPCLSPDAGFAAMLAADDIAFGDALAWLIADALERTPSGVPRIESDRRDRSIGESTPPATGGGRVRYRTEAVARDVAALRGLVAATSEFSLEERFVALELLEARLASGAASDYFLIFADLDDQLVGYAAWGPIPLTKSAYDLYWIVVHPAHRGGGIGRRLLELGERAVAARGGGRLYIETSSRREYARTRDFYVRAGYSRIAHFEDFYANDDAKIVYCKAVQCIDQAAE